MPKWFATQRRFCGLGVLFNLSLSLVLLLGSLNTGQAVSLPSSCRRPPDPASLSITQDVCFSTLTNGLTVLTKEVHKAPVVTVQVWYEVGSRHEPPGLNGISHQLEHMLFKGTFSRPLQWGRLFNALGSESNAFTSYDHTVYFNTAESSKLRTLLTLEADRMQNSFIAKSDLNSEKRVVISELAGYENRPNYRLNRAIMQAAFPHDPYGKPVGGTQADVEQLSVEQVQQHYQNYYGPENATLVIVGDFQTQATLKAVQDIFGKIPRHQSSPVSPVGDRTQPQEPNSQNPIILRESGSAAQLQMVYPLPNIHHPDVPALQVMDYIFSKGRSSRLYQALVETGLASDASGSTAHLADGGWYRIYATATSTESLDRLVKVLDDAIAQLQTQGVTPEELDRAKVQLRAQNLLRQRDITQLAMQLGDDQTTAGDYTWSDRYLAAVTQLSAADIQRVAQTYLQTSQRTLGFFQPTDSPERLMTNASIMPSAENFNLETTVDPVQVQQYLPPLSEEVIETQPTLPQKFTLANGLQVLLIQDSSTPTLTLSAYLQAGSQFDSDTKAGLARLTAENLMNGTRTNNALTLAKTLADRGANLQFRVNREGVMVEGQALAWDLDALIETLADILQNPSFPVEKFERSRQRMIDALQLELDSPSRLAQRTLQQAIYPENHPFHPFPTETTLKQITRRDLVKFYQTHYRPDTTAIALVGDFTLPQVQQVMERYFNPWSVAGSPPNLEFPPVEFPPSRIALNPILPGKTQSTTYMGYKGIGRQDPRYYAALVLNQILGGDTLSSRLGTEVRDRLGLTYGIYSYFQTGLNPGPFVIEMQTSPEDVQQAISSTLTLLDQLQSQGVTEEEVQVAKTAIASRYPVSLKDPDFLAAEVLLHHVYGLPSSELRTFPQKIDGVTLEAVNQAAKELLHPGHLVVVTAGPAREKASTP